MTEQHRFLPGEACNRPLILTRAQQTQLLEHRFCSGVKMETFGPARTLEPVDHASEGDGGDFEQFGKFPLRRSRPLLDRRQRAPLRPRERLPARQGHAAGARIDHLYSVGGGISYDLDLFGGLRRQVEQRAAEAEAQLRQTEAAHLSIAGQVVNQALTIAAIRAQIATANRLLADDQRNVELTRKRQRGGEGTLVEVLNAQSQYAADRGDIPQLDQQLGEARHLLATLVGVAPAELGVTDIDLAMLTLPDTIPVSLPSELVHRRPDILQAEAELHAAAAGVGVATARLYPNITLGATLTQGAPGIGDLTKNAFRGYDLFAGLTAPIFHGGTLKAERAAAIDRAKASEATYQQTVLTAFGQVADLLSAIQSDARSVATQNESVAVADRSRRLSRRSFEVGNSGILQVLETERLYQRSSNGLVLARARQFLNIARLYVATAGGWTGQGQTGSRAGTPSKPGEGSVGSP